MQLINDTAWEARLFTGAIDEQQLGAWLVARATFTVDAARGTLTPSAVRWPVLHEPVATRYGTFPSDNHPRHRGCDLVILGSARCRRPTTSTTASFRVGDFERSIDVIGDRRWVRDGRGALVASAPEPFTRMPLDWSRAFGGRPEAHGESFAHPLNPDGRGACVDEAAVEGSPLPNLEDPSERIRAWSDSPTPAAWGPVARATPWQMADGVKRAGRALTPEEFDAHVRGLTPAGAVPRNVAPGARGDEQVRVALGDDRWEFALPGWSLRVDVRLGEERVALRTSLAGLWFLADTQLLVVTFRSRWRYPMRPREARRATLLADAA